MKKIRIGKNIFPDLTEEILSKIESKLVKKYKINIYFLFEDGIEFHYPDSYEIKSFPGDISFWEIEPVVSYVENLNSLDFFYAYDDDPFLSIPTCCDVRGDMLLEKLRNFIDVIEEPKEEDDDEA